MKLDLAIFRLASGLATHAAARQALISENIANADTPGYRARDLRPFGEVFDGSARAPFAPAATRPGHGGLGRAGGGFEAVADARTGAASPNRNDVSIEDQMARAAETRIAHDTAIGVYRKSLDILRLGLGRAR